MEAKLYVSLYMHEEDNYNIRLSQLKLRKPKSTHFIDYPYYKIIFYN